MGRGWLLCATCNRLLRSDGATCERRKVCDDTLECLSEGRDLLTRQSCQRFAQGLVDEIPEHWQENLGFLGDEKRARSAIGKPMASLCEAQRFEPVESTPEPGRSDCRQFREAPLGDSFILDEHEQRSALREFERQISGALLEASHVQPARFAQTEAGK